MKNRTGKGDDKLSGPVSLSKQNREKTMSDKQLHQFRKEDGYDDGARIWHQCRVIGSGEESCPGADLLSSWIDGRLAGEERERIEAHLSHCGQCLETVVCIRRELAGRPEKVSCSLKPLHDLVRPADRPSTFAELIHRLFPLRPEPVVVFAGLVLLMAASGYLGSQMAVDRLFIQRTLMAEISFDFDVADSGIFFTGGTTP
jgi:hypothetical protein